jgi:hypothetical protein
MKKPRKPRLTPKPVDDVAALEPDSVSDRDAYTVGEPIFLALWRRRVQTNPPVSMTTPERVFLSVWPFAAELRDEDDGALANFLRDAVHDVREVAAAMRKIGAWDASRVLLRAARLHSRTSERLARYEEELRDRGSDRLAETAVRYALAHRSRMPTLPQRSTRPTRRKPNAG